MKHSHRNSNTHIAPISLTDNGYIENMMNIAVVQYSLVHTCMVFNKLSAYFIIQNIYIHITSIYIDFSTEAIWGS